MFDTLLGIITLIAFQLFKLKAADELNDKLEAEKYNHALDEKEASQ